MKKSIALIISLFMALISYSALAKNIHHKSNVDKQIYCLAQAIYYEARGESEEGQIAVGHVILNRTKSDQFPPNVCSVIAQKGQFQWYSNKKLRKGRVFKIRENKDLMELARKLYFAEIMGVRVDLTQKSLFFSSNGKYPTRDITKSIKVGRHQFFRFNNRETKLQLI